MTMILWLCTAALGYACTLVCGPQLWLEVGCTVLVGGYACWVTYRR